MAVEVLSEFVVPLAAGLGAAGIGHWGSSRRLHHQLEADRAALQEERAAEERSRKVRLGVNGARELIPRVRRLGDLAGTRRKSRATHELFKEVLQLTISIPKPARLEVSAALDAIMQCHVLAELHYLEAGEILGLSMGRAVLCLHALKHGLDLDDRRDWLGELGVLDEGIRGSQAERQWSREERRTKWLTTRPEVAAALREAGRDMPANCEGAAP